MSISPRIAGLVGLALLVVGVGLVWQGGDATSSEPVSPTASSVDTTSVSRTLDVRTRATAAYDTDRFAADLDRWRALHAPVGRLSLEETKALVAARDAQAEALAAGIGALAADDLHEVVLTLDGARTRDRLVVIDGLGRNASPEAVAALEALYDQDPGYTTRRNVLTALGDSPAPGHHALLVEAMWSAEDERLSQTAAMMLRGEAAATDALIDALDSALPMNTRLEAVASLGAVGSADAEAALREVVADDAVNARVRAYAERELVRSFG